MKIKIEVEYEPGYGWKPGFRGTTPDGKPFSYNGEYRATLDEAYAAAKRMLITYELMDLAS